VISFIHNPKRLLGPASYGGDILSLRQKLAVFEEMGIALAILIDFSEDFSKIKGRDFIRMIKDRAGPAFLAVGANFRCGYRLDTGAAEIGGFFTGEGVPVEVLPPLLEGGEPVSSSRVRGAVRSGDFALARTLLGRPFVLDLADLPPEGEGRRYDPAARFRLVPPDGRYLVRVRGGGLAGGREIEAAVEEGKLLIPLPGRVEGVEFL
jgi:riboflavin kinase/FMN adenylyltransferase